LFGRAISERHAVCFFSISQLIANRQELYFKILRPIGFLVEAYLPFQIGSAELLRILGGSTRIVSPDLTPMCMISSAAERCRTGTENVVRGLESASIRSEVQVAKGGVDIDHVSPRVQRLARTSHLFFWKKLENSRAAVIGIASRAPMTFPFSSRGRRGYDDP